MEVRNRVRSVPNMKEPDGVEQALTEKQAGKLVRACHEPLRSLVQVALLTGCRRGELIGQSKVEPLRWDEVDLKRGFITFQRTKSGKKRKVPITQPLREVLRAIPRHTQCPYVFWHRKRGDALKWDDVQYAWETARRRAGLPSFRFHDLRHYAESGIMPNHRPMPSLCGADLGSHSA